MPLCNEGLPLDARLVRRMAEGDRSALGALYRRHAPRLLGIGLRILRDRNEAEDVLHDVFLQAWSTAAEYAPERGSVGSWLSMRMRCRSIDRLRRSDRARGIDASLNLECWGGTTTLPAWAGESRPVERALQHLSGLQRQVLALSYFEGLGSTEVAEVLGVSVGTVKSRIASALAKLRLALV